MSEQAFSAEEAEQQERLREWLKVRKLRGCRAGLDMAQLPAPLPACSLRSQKSSLSPNFPSVKERRNTVPHINHVTAQGDEVAAYSTRLLSHNIRLPIPTYVHPLPVQLCQKDREDRDVGLPPAACQPRTPAPPTRHTGRRVYSVQAWGSALGGDRGQTRRPGSFPCGPST